MEFKMRHFHDITDRKQLRAICRALNVLIWKVPGMRGARDVHDSAEWWAGELLDKGMKIKWSRKREQFHI